MGASHLAAFAAGATLAAAATAALAVPARTDTARFKALDAFAQTLSAVETQYVDPVDEQQLLYDAQRGMLHNLDPHSTFLPPSRYKRMRQDTEGEFGGVGLTLGPGMPDGGSPAGSAGRGAEPGRVDARPSVPPYPIVDEVVPGSPAEMAGLEPDDRIATIDGAPTAVPGKELREAGAWEAALRGASGTRVTLGVIRVGWKEPHPFAIVRAQVKQPSVRARVIEPRIGYLAIARFAEATSADVLAALRDLRGKGALDVLVLDLRDDPGGLVDQAVATADLFVDGGTIVSIHGRRGAVETQVAHKGGPAESVPIIALVDGGTASAAEIVAAALHDHGRARLVGVPTYGKGTVQTFFDLDDGSGLKLTTARYYTPDGKSLESKGLPPDVRVEAFSAEVITAGGGAKPPNDARIAATSTDDPQLAAAVKLARDALGAR